MKAQATLEMMIIFVVTIGAVMMVFYPLAQAHKDFQKQADYIEKEQAQEDYFVALQVLCNGGSDNSVSPSSSSLGCTMQVTYTEVTFECGDEKGTFPGFFKGCVLENDKRPV